MELYSKLIIFEYGKADDTSLLNELGVVIEPHVSALSKKLNNMIGDSSKPSMEEIIKETRAVRAKS
jgi:hypothetical protein